MSDYVFIFNEDFFYDPDKQTFHGTDGNVEIPGRLANVINLFIDQLDYRIQLKADDQYVSGPDFHLTKRTFRNYISEINELGRQIGAEGSKIIRHQAMPESEHRWTLQVFRNDLPAKDAYAKTESRMIFRKMLGDSRTTDSTRLCESIMKQNDSSWFSSASVPTQRHQIAREFSRYLEAICCNTSTVITEYRSEMAVDVSGWPEEPYHITQTISQILEGDAAGLFFEQSELQDELKASTFRYASLVLRDEAGRVLLRRDRIPHWSEVESVPSLQTADGWAEETTRSTLALNDPTSPTIECLHYTLEKDGFSIEARSWPYHSAAFSWENPENIRAPRCGRQSGFYTADIQVKLPPNRRIQIEYSVEYDAWFVSDNRFFTNLVYSPSISARIIGAERNNSGYDFRLRQFSSQSPFWRREDGKHYVKDVMLAGNNPHYLSWHYPDQWLMLGEGYVVTVDAYKPFERSGND